MQNYGSIANQMLSLEAYENALGIPPEDNKSLVTLVTMNYTTDYMVNTMLEKTIDRIIQLKLHTITGLNVMELLDLPTYVLQMLMRSVTRNGILENERLQKLENKLKSDQDLFK